MRAQQVCPWCGESQTAGAHDCGMCERPLAPGPDRLCAECAERNRLLLEAEAGPAIREGGRYALARRRLEAAAR